jgi:hypothetical protein
VCVPLEKKFVESYSTTNLFSTSKSLCEELHVGSGFTSPLDCRFVRLKRDTFDSLVKGRGQVRLWCVDLCTRELLGTEPPSGSTVQHIFARWLLVLALAGVPYARSCESKP